MPKPKKKLEFNLNFIKSSKIEKLIQNRRTEFASEQERAEYDARGLINLFDELKQRGEDVGPRNPENIVSFAARINAGKLAGHIDTTKYKELLKLAVAKLLREEADAKPIKFVAGTVGKQTTAVVAAAKLAPELKEGLKQIKEDFDSLPELHYGIEWDDVKRSLEADPETLAQLISDNYYGHSMNVFKLEDGYFIFASAWMDCDNIHPKHKKLVYDLAAQKRCSNAQSLRNAVEIATDKGATLAEPALYKQLLKAIQGKTIKGKSWLATKKTDDCYKYNAEALCGDSYRVTTNGTAGILDSLRVSRRVKKV